MFYTLWRRVYDTGVILEFKGSVQDIRKKTSIEIISLRNTLKQQLLCKKYFFPWK